MLKQLLILSIAVAGHAYSQERGETTLGQLEIQGAHKVLTEDAPEQSWESAKSEQLQIKLDNENYLSFRLQVIDPMVGYDKIRITNGTLVIQGEIIEDIIQSNDFDGHSSRYTLIELDSLNLKIGTRIVSKGSYWHGQKSEQTFITAKLVDEQGKVYFNGEVETRLFK